jgi:hypothetical protein
MIKNLSLTLAILATIWFAKRTVSAFFATTDDEPETREIQTMLKDDTNTGRHRLTIALAKAVDKKQSDGDPKAPVTRPYERPSEDLLAPMPNEIYDLFRTDYPDIEVIGDTLLRYLESLPEEDIHKRLEVLRLASAKGVASPQTLTRIGLRQAEVPSDDFGLGPEHLEALKLGANLVAQNAGSLTQAATLYAQIAALHSSPEVQQELQRVFFDKKE